MLRKAALFLLCALVSPAARAAPRAALPELTFEKTTLPNGLQLVLHVDRKLPLVHVNLWYHVGSKNERRGRTGFAHLFEHMMLQGSKNEPEDYFSFFQRIGARAGRDSNGTTWNDRTSYFTTAPSGSLELMLWAHADLLATLPDALTQAKLDNQRAVVRNERRQTTENVPYGRVDEISVRNIFPPDHPYSWSVIGSHEDLMAASLDDVKDFFRTYYAPNNLSLTITGDFDPAEAKRLVEKYFGGIPPGPPLERPRHYVPRLDGEKVVEVADRVPLEKVFLFWAVPARGDADEPELTLAGGVLADGLSSRLRKALVYDARLCSDVSAYNDPMEIAGVFSVDATLRAGAKAEEVERIIDREIARLAKEGPTAAELERSKAQGLTAFVVRQQDLGAFGGKGDTLNEYNTYFGDPGKYKEELGRSLAVTPKGVREAVARWIDTRNRVVLRFHPETARPGGKEVDRASMPALGKDNPFRPPVVVSDKLENGLEVHVVEQHDVPAVTATFLTRAGGVYDPPGKEGLAYLTIIAMERGTRGNNAIAIENAFAELGARLTTDYRRERVGERVSVLKANLKPALDLLADVLRNPSFPEAEVDRERKQYLDELADAEVRPASVANRVRDLLAFGAAHPYGRPTTHGSVSSITRSDLVAFHAANWKPGGAALLFVGDITLPEAKALAAASFGSWSGATPAAPAIPVSAAPLRGKVVLVDVPGAAQTVVAQILSSPASKGDDYFGWRLASEVYGGGGSARLWMNLRQDKGYSYGVYASISHYASGFEWYAQGGVQTDKTKESVVEFVAEEKGLAGGRPISAKELEDARQSLIRGYATAFATNADVAARVAELWSRRWSFNYLSEEPAGLAKATLPEAQAAANRYVVPGQTTLLLVGDRKKIEAGVRELKLGEVVILDVEGRPVGSR